MLLAIANLNLPVVLPLHTFLHEYNTQYSILIEDYFPVKNYVYTIGLVQYHQAVQEYVSSYILCILTVF